MIDDRMIAGLFVSLGVGRNYKAYWLAIEMVKLRLENERHGRTAGRDVYATLSRDFGVSIEAIRTRMRTLVNRVWKKNPEGLFRMAGYTMEKCPTVEVFMKILCAHLQRSAQGEETV